MLKTGTVHTWKTKGNLYKTTFTCMPILMYMYMSTKGFTCVYFWAVFNDAICNVCDGYWDIFLGYLMIWFVYVGGWPWKI